MQADGQALPSGCHAERSVQSSRRQEYRAANAGGPRAQQGSKLETRALFKRWRAFAYDDLSRGGAAGKFDPIRKWAHIAGLSGFRFHGEPSRAFSATSTLRQMSGSRTGIGSRPPARYSNSWGIGFSRIRLTGSPGGGGGVSNPGRASRPAAAAACRHSSSPPEAGEKVGRSPSLSCPVCGATALSHVKVFGCRHLRTVSLGAK
jgi:hypothetical protein